MSSSTGGGDEENDAVLSDLEGDDQPVQIVSIDDISVEKYRQLLVEFDREKFAREEAEKSKSEAEIKLNKFKGFAHEAMKRRDESLKLKDEILKEKERIQLERDEIAKKYDELAKSKDLLESEIQTSKHMLVSGMEKISNKISSNNSNFKNFLGLGLPKSSKYNNGLQSVVYGVIKRTNEIFEEMSSYIDGVNKGAREQIEQRNYEIAIEVSNLEATVSGLRDEVVEKNSAIERLEKSLVEKEDKVVEVEKDLSEKSILVEKEAFEKQEMIREYDEKLKEFESKIELQRPLLVDQLSLVAKIHERLYDVIGIVDSNHLDSELSESLFLPQQTDVEENLRASLAGMGSIDELTRIVVDKTRDLVEEKSREVKSLSETVSRLVKEKEHIGSLLRSALSKRMKLDPSSKTNELFQTAENGLREAGIDFKFSMIMEDSKVAGSHEKGASLDTEEYEIYNLAGALENIVKASQLEIIELQRTVEESKAEVHLLKEHVEAQSKELGIRMHRIEELEEKERLANENVEGLMMDVAAAEEEITRWKVAAEQEAAAGRAVEQDFVAQLSAIKQELEEARIAMLESEKKLKFKEETAAAAMAAREAAEKSLRLADMRASRLRDKVEELSQQLEEFETRDDSRGRTGPRYVCWPWQWLGLEFVGTRRPETQQQISNEMELSEPLSEPLL